MASEGLKMKKQTVRRGYTFRNPKGTLGCVVYSNRSDAWESAAFATKRPYSHIVLPDDKQRARKQGFRVVPVTMRVRD